MIAYLSGTIRDIRVVSGAITSLTVVVQGVGFSVQIPSRYAVKAGQSIELEIYTHTAQEQASQLFGFQDSDERFTFGLVLSCSGIGPKLALAIVNALSALALKSAVMAHDVKLLSTIEGVGAKKAENLILQLKDKIAKLTLSQESEDPVIGRLKQLNDAFAGLGYTRTEVNEVIEDLKEKDMLYNAPFAELLRKGLAFLSKRP